MTSRDLLHAALQSAQAAWTGCDWDTEFGPRRINLRGLSSRQARLAAQATRGDESTQWREVIHYLGAVEQDARLAAELASEVSTSGASETLPRQTVDWRRRSHWSPVIVSQVLTPGYAH